MYSSKENINILTRLLVEYNIGHVVVCPGSRNAALVHNFNESPYIECHPVTDERSAAFVALGMALKTDEIIAVCVTSGSALLNLLPGVAEASYQHKGILVISADRPQQWIDQLDGQTLPQQGALGSFVEKSVTLPECKDDEERWLCRRLACEAIMSIEKEGRSAHINVPISEPLFESTEPELPFVEPVFPIYWGDDIYEDIFDQELRDYKRPMLVIGQMNRGDIDTRVIEELSKHMVVLAEQLSVDCPSPSLDTLFTIMGKDTEDYQPDMVIYIGGTTISKRLRLFLRGIDECTVMMQNEVLKLEDPTKKAGFLIVGDAQELVCGLLDRFGGKQPSAFVNLWNDLIAKTRRSLEAEPETLEARAVMELEKYIGPEDDIFYANSSSVRLAAKYAHHFVYCNRGLNGIEGSLSTAVGASLVSEGNVFLVIGDLSFFYDQNALWNQHLRGNLRILLLNNGGGEIFSTLPGLADSPARDELVMAKHNTTAEGVCLEYGIAHLVASKADELPSAINFLATEHSHRPILLEVLNNKR